METAGKQLWRKLKTMSPGTAGVVGKGNREEDLDRGDVSQEELTEPLDRLKTETEREDLKMST